LSKAIATATAGPRLLKSKHKVDREGNFIYIGAYNIGDDVVALLGEVGETNGNVFYAHLEKDGYAKPPHSKIGEGCPLITVGLGTSNWRTCLSVLMQETMEYAYMKLHTRYNNSENWSLTHSDYLFVATHQQFSEAISRSALFLTYAMSDLNKIYRMKIKL
jgi:hypothetical protein